MDYMYSALLASLGRASWPVHHFTRLVVALVPPGPACAWLAIVCETVLPLAQSRFMLPTGLFCVLLVLCEPPGLTLCWRADSQKCGGGGGGAWALAAAFGRTGWRWEWTGLQFCGHPQCCTKLCKKETVKAQGAWVAG